MEKEMIHSLGKGTLRLDPKAKTPTDSCELKKIILYVHSNVVDLCECGKASILEMIFEFRLEARNEGLDHLFFNRSGD